MEFVPRLHAMLSEDEHGWTSADAVQVWNDEIEAFLFKRPYENETSGKQGRSNNEVVSKAELDAIANQLCNELVKKVSESMGILLDSHEERLKLLLEKVACADDHFEDIRILDSSSWSRLEPILRTSSNFCRWYLQAYLQSSVIVYPMVSSPFQSIDMLRVLVFLIEFNGNKRENEKMCFNAQSLTRHASLLLFYATFSPRSPNDEEMQNTHNLLVNELRFFPRVLKLLAYAPSNSAAIALSLIRNIHNLLASFSGAIKLVQETALPFTGGQTEQAPWQPKQDENTDNLITYPSIFRDILIWALNTPTLPKFPGPKDDRRPDLVVEILGIIFAMGGSEVARALRHPSPNSSLSQLVTMALQQLDSSDARCYQVKLSTITVLTDACPSFGTFLVERKSVPALMEITEQQMDKILAARQLDSTTVSALVPSLAVLYKFSSGNPTFREAAKEIIFPPEQEDGFWKLAHAQLTDCASHCDNNIDRVPSVNNMHPLDAPRGSLRWKFIRFMTWTESHIKRYASELLWALCDEDPKEFVLRTGLGNAMALLGAKGMAHLPASSNIHQG